MNEEQLNDNDGIDGELERLQDRIEQWRRQNGPGRRRRIAGDIWDAAAVLARQHGVYGVARRLRLNYAALKKRAAASVPGRRRQVEAPFVELMLPGVKAEEPRSASTVVELIHRNGTRMTIRLAPHDAQDVMGLAGVFLRHRS